MSVKLYILNQVDVIYTIEASSLHSHVLFSSPPFNVSSHQVEALRTKLGHRHRELEQKEEQLMKMQKEMTDSKTESADRMENVSEKEGKKDGRD